MVFDPKVRYKKRKKCLVKGDIETPAMVVKMSRFLALFHGTGGRSK
jgi:hypothetical protein